MVTGRQARRAVGSVVDDLLRFYAVHSVRRTLQLLHQHEGWVNRSQSLSQDSSSRSFQSQCGLPTFHSLQVELKFWLQTPCDGGRRVGFQVFCASGDSYRALSCLPSRLRQYTSIPLVRLFTFTMWRMTGFRYSAFLGLPVRCGGVPRTRMRPPAVALSTSRSSIYLSLSAGFICFCPLSSCDAELGGVPMPHALMVNVFNHSHKYYSLGIRLYFGTIPGTIPRLPRLQGCFSSVDWHHVLYLVLTAVDVDDQLTRNNKAESGSM